jgi:hypothetical protein
MWRDLGDLLSVGPSNRLSVGGSVPKERDRGKDKAEGNGTGNESPEKVSLLAHLLLFSVVCCVSRARIAISSPFFQNNLSPLVKTPTLHLSGFPHLYTPLLSLEHAHHGHSQHRHRHRRSDLHRKVRVHRLAPHFMRKFLNHFH